MYNKSKKADFLKGQEYPWEAAKKRERGTEKRNKECFSRFLWETLAEIIVVWDMRVVPGEVELSRSLRRLEVVQGE